MIRKPNGKKIYKFYFRITLLAFGYNKDYFNWGYGHETCFTTIYFLFWSLHIQQAFIKYE